MTNIIRGTVAILLLHYCICNNYLPYSSFLGGITLITVLQASSVFVQCMHYLVMIVSSYKTKVKTNFEHKKETVNKVNLKENVSLQRTILIESDYSFSSTAMYFFVWFEYQKSVKIETT
jgi:hypothetical protein